MCISSFTVASVPIWPTQCAASGTIDRRRRIPHRFKLLTFSLLAWNIFQDKIFLVEQPPIHARAAINRGMSFIPSYRTFSGISVSKQMELAILCAVA
jgi:hypothetical protein